MDINVTQLAERIERGENDFFLLDVREPYEWSAGHLEGALHIPLQQVPARLRELPSEKEIIVYCRSGGRSANAQRFLQSNGFPNVRNLLGGIAAWKREVDQSIRVV